MATNIDKGLYAAPLGIDALGEAEGAMEIDIVNPDMVTLDDGSVEITLVPDDAEDGEGEFSDNLAEYMDEGTLATLAGDLTELVDTDTSSRKEWSDTFVKDRGAGFPLRRAHRALGRCVWRVLHSVG
jgi:hypothetical protein